MMLWNEETHLFEESADPTKRDESEGHGLHHLRQSNAFDAGDVERAGAAERMLIRWLTVACALGFLLTLAAAFRFVDGLAAWVWHLWGHR